MLPHRRNLFDTKNAYNLIFLPSGHMPDDENEVFSEDEDGVAIEEDVPFEDDIVGDPDYEPPVEANTVEELLDNIRNLTREDEAPSDNAESSNQVEDLPTSSSIVEDEDDAIHDESESPEFLQTVANCLPGLQVEVMTEELMLPTNKDYSFTWRKRKPANYPPTDTAFKGASFSAPPVEYPTPKEYFDLFFGRDMIEDIAYQTNLYYSQEHSAAMLNTNVVVRMPKYRMYWSPQTRFELIAKCMTQRRFDKLRSHIHFNDNSNMKGEHEEGYDRLFKVRPMITKLRQNCLNKECEEMNSIDERMIPFKGRNKMKQYVKNKPKKWGIKVFVRAGASGIVYDFEIYTGKGTITDEYGIGMGGASVLRLCETLPKQLNYKCFIDNWFTGLPLLIELKKYGMLATGTIRSDRIGNSDVDSDKVLKKKGRGSHSARYDSEHGICVVKWFDNKKVLVASNYLDANPVGSCKRWSKEQKKEIQVTRPHLIKVYNENMGGVDLGDMIASLYTLKIRCKRWYLRLWYFCIEVALTNAWFLYKRHKAQHNDTKVLSSLEFRLEVSDALIHAGKRADLQIKKRGRPSLEDRENIPEPAPQRARYQQAPSKDAVKDRFDHFPVFIDAEGKKRNRCKLEGCNQVSPLICQKCKVSLCLVKNRNCFLKYHCQ